MDANEHALVYRARGMRPPEPEEHARTVLTTLHLDAVAPEAAGVDPHEAVGSAWRAAVSSYCESDLRAQRLREPHQAG